jgi:hypothetical protein
MDKMAAWFLAIKRLICAWQQRLAVVSVLAALLLAGCDISLASTSSPISNSGNPVVIANQGEAIYLASNCNGPTALTVRAGTNLVDLGPASSVCEQVAYPSEAGYSLTGYVPVYSIHRANNSVRCVYPNGCAIHTGPDATMPVLSTLRPGDRVAGRGTAGTGAIISDGSNYSWWEVIDPNTGQPGDIYGTFSVAF